MAYPIELLPKPGYKYIDCDISNHFLLRIVYLKENEIATDSETGKIKLECICSPKERIIDFSCSLLGIYQPRHIPITLTEIGKENYNHYCAPDSAITSPEEPVEYVNGTDRRTFWCVQIDRLNNQPFNYQLVNDVFESTCLVVHTPMMWNFWHFSLHWRINGQLVSKIHDKEDKKKGQKIGHAVRTLLSQFLKEGLPQEFPIVTESCFSHN